MGRTARSFARVSVYGMACVLLSVAINSCAWGNHPELISTKQDIHLAKTNVEDIDIRDLPLEDYPLLAKFWRLKRVRLYSSEGTLATDEKLSTLASLDFTNLIDINLLNCRLISDGGIRALSNIQSLKMLQLEGTAITDASAIILRSMTNLSGVNLANCGGITMNGLKILAASESIQEIGFSADNLSQDAISSLFALFKSVKFCQLVDPKQRLDRVALTREAEKYGFHLVVKATGALQDMQSVK
jgi:hypothetical protein